MSGGSSNGRRDAEARPGHTLGIGITGPIGCGKSTVAGWLGELGAVVIDADDVARELTAAGTPAAAAIAAGFGPGLVRADGSLDRAALGRIVFADPDALARLEAIVHPAVRPAIVERMERAAADGALAVVVEAIKLVEGGLAALCDEVWLVTCDAGEQLERLLARGTIGAADAQARIAAQGGLGERLAPAATRVIDTSGTAAEAHERVGAAWRAALEGYGAGKAR
jgi:dephospho-CoA kinase